MPFAEVRRLWDFFYRMSKDAADAIKALKSDPLVRSSVIQVLGLATPLSCEDVAEYIAGRVDPGHTIALWCSPLSRGSGDASRSKIFRGCRH